MNYEMQKVEFSFKNLFGFFFLHLKQFEMFGETISKSIAALLQFPLWNRWIDWLIE